MLSTPSGLIGVGLGTAALVFGITYLSRPGGNIPMDEVDADVDEVMDIPEVTGFLPSKPHIPSINLSHSRFTKKNYNN